jgi:hypothetical protein
MVVRGPDWTPQAGDEFVNTIIRHPASKSASDTTKVTESNDNPRPSNTATHSSNEGEEKLQKCHVGVYQRKWHTNRPAKPERKGNNPYTRQIHGSFKMPPGYQLGFVPMHAKYQDTNSYQSSNSSGTITLSCSYNSVKVLVSLGQAIYAITTLYRSHGDQITQYGYAAFGLMVAPYAVISVVNFVGSLI